MTKPRFLITVVASVCLGGASAEQFTVVHIPDTQHYTGERNGGAQRCAEHRDIRCCGSEGCGPVSRDNRNEQVAKKVFPTALNSGR